jgi:hypothetical protein
MRLPSALALVFIIPPALPAQGTRPRAAARSAPNAAVTGTYEWHRGTGAGCMLAVARQGRDSIAFQLECNRGAPSYNSGFVDGVIPLRDGVAIFRTSEYRNLCELRIRFRGRMATVTQTGEDVDCGFGAWVSADGTYRRISRARPRWDLAPNGERRPPGAGSVNEEDRRRGRAHPSHVASTSHETTGRVP